MEYREYLKTEDWQAKRERKLSRKKTCGICAAPIVDIHHLNYKNLFDVEMADLRRMCRRCHFLAHDLQKIAKSSLEARITMVVGQSLNRPRKKSLALQK
jgi:hypothetical protein